MKILLIKLSTDGKDMHLPLAKRLERWERACDRAREKGCSIVAAPEYFFVNPAIKTREAVEKVVASHGGMDVINKPGTPTFISPDLCDILGVGSSDESTMRRIENGLSSDAYTYYTSSRSLPRNEWTDSVKPAVRAQGQASSTVPCVYFGGTSVYSKRLADKKPREDWSMKGSPRPWEAELSRLSYSQYMKDEESTKTRVDWNELEVIRNRAMVTWAEKEGKPLKFYKYYEYQEITDVLFLNQRDDAAYAGRHPRERLFLKGPNVLSNYMFEHGNKLWGVEICMDHVRGALRKVATGATTDESSSEANAKDLSDTLGTPCDIHVVLSASCESTWENVCVKKGGLYIHCDSRHEDETRFGCWQRDLGGDFNRLAIVEESAHWSIFKVRGSKLM